MPSYLHELILVLFRNRSESAADLLRELHVQLPEYDEVRIESSDLSDLKPAEYRADLVSFLVRKSQKVLGVVVEVQLSRDENKRYTWPAYVANLRDRHRCPVCLLVITTDNSVARWAGGSIFLGPGTRCTPWVIGPSNAPVVTESHYAKENVELAVLSAVEHLRNPDVELVERILEAAVGASAKLDPDRSQLYFDLISLSLPATAPKELKDLMNSLGFEYQSDYARRYTAQGRAEGRAEGLIEGRTEGRTEGRMELILAVLTKRFGPLSDSIQTRIRRAHDARPDEIADLLLTAQTIEQALSSLP